MELLEPLRRARLRVGARRPGGRSAARALSADRGHARGPRPDRGHRWPRRRSTRRRPGWCWPATCRFLDEAHARAPARGARSGAHCATAYRSSHDGLPEPLCAIYEPRSHAAARATTSRTGKHCPRKFLMQRRRAPARGAQSARARQHQHARGVCARPAHVLRAGEPRCSRKNLTVQYYALLREQAGRREEAVATARARRASCTQELQRRYPFTLAGGAAARRDQRRVRRLVAAAARGRRRRVHSAGGRRLS